MPRDGVIAVVLTLLLVIPALAQDAAAQGTAQSPDARPTPAKISPANPPPADCSAMASISACNSFNEMLKARDSEILAYLDGNGVKTYVCFRSNEDLFLVISFREPSQYLWVPDKLHSHFFKQRGVVTAAEYRGGVMEDYRPAFVTWGKLGEDDENPTATPDRKTRLDSRVAEANVDHDEITTSYSFTNYKNGITDYILRIRRATKRFVEDFAVKTDHTQFSTNGYCSEYGGN